MRTVLVAAVLALAAIANALPQGEAGNCKHMFSQIFDRMLQTNHSLVQSR